MAEVVLRPDGRAPYRATKPTAADVLVDDDGSPVAVMVWRTHDVDVATALAGREWSLDGHPEEPLPGVVEVGWWKKVPCRPEADYAWIAHPQVPGEGSPAVRFSTVVPRG